MLGVDITIFETLHSLAGRSPWLNGLIVFLGQYLVYLLAIAFLYLVIKTPPGRRLYLFSLATLSVILSAGILNQIIQFISHRAGPSIILSFTPLISSGANSVFPSGYMAFLVPLGLAVWQFSRKKGVWFMGLTFVAGVFMVVAGVNWPGDIVVGMIVGVVSFTLIRLFFREQASTPAFTSKDSLLA